MGAAPMVRATGAALQHRRPRPADGLDVVPARPHILSVPEALAPGRIVRPGTGSGELPMTAVRTVAALVVAGLALAAPAHAQTTTTRSETVASGKVVRLVISPNLKKDCSAGPLPEIKIVTAPKNGQLKSKSGKLKTPASYRCPNKDAQATAVFYKSKADFTGEDQVLIEVKTAEGTVEKQDIRITVGSAKAEDKKSDAKKTEDKRDDKDLSDL